MTARDFYAYMNAFDDNGNDDEQFVVDWHAMAAHNELATLALRDLDALRALVVEARPFVWLKGGKGNEPRSWHPGNMEKQAAKVAAKARNLLARIDALLAEAEALP